MRRNEKKWEARRNEEKWEEMGRINEKKCKEMRKNEKNDDKWEEMRRINEEINKKKWEVMWRNE